MQKVHKPTGSSGDLAMRCLILEAAPHFEAPTPAHAGQLGTNGKWLVIMVAFMSLRLLAHSQVRHVGALASSVLAKG